MVCDILFLDKSQTLTVVLAKSAGEPVWKAMLALVKNITEAMLANFPNFWKMSTSFMEGKFRKVRADPCHSPVTDWMIIVYFDQFATECYTMQDDGSGHRQIVYISSVPVLHVLRHGCHVTKLKQWRAIQISAEFALDIDCSLSHEDSR